MILQMAPPVKPEGDKKRVGGCNFSFFAVAFDGGPTPFKSDPPEVKLWRNLIKPPCAQGGIRTPFGRDISPIL